MLLHRELVWRTAETMSQAQSLMLRQMASPQASIRINLRFLLTGLKVKLMLKASQFLRRKLEE